VGLHEGHAVPHVLRKRLAGCFYVVAATLRFLFADAAIEVRSTAPEPVHNKRGATTKGKLGDVIRQHRVVAPCTPTEIAVTVTDSAA
jgi:hypothetical protein